MGRMKFLSIFGVMVFLLTPILASASTIICENYRIGIGEVGRCALVDCTRGTLIVTNEEDEPLISPVSKDISSEDNGVEFLVKDVGRVLVRGLCFSPSVSMDEVTVEVGQEGVLNRIKGLLGFSSTPETYCCQTSSGWVCTTKRYCNALGGIVRLRCDDVSDCTQTTTTTICHKEGEPCVVLPGEPWCCPGLECRNNICVKPCKCGNWWSVGCGAGSCRANEMAYRRTCNPWNCDTQWKCEYSKECEGTTTTRGHPWPTTTRGGTTTSTTLPSCDEMCKELRFVSGTCRKSPPGCQAGEVMLYRGRVRCASGEVCCCLTSTTTTIVSTTSSSTTSTSVSTSSSTTSTSTSSSTTSTAPNCPPESCQSLLNLAQSLRHKSCEDEEYNPVGDVNKDGEINVVDIETIITHCGDGEWCEEKLSETQNPCPILCDECRLGNVCKCTFNKNYDSGLWILKNDEGSPLPEPTVKTIPPTTVEFLPIDVGRINVTAIWWLEGSTSMAVRRVEVKSKFLSCPSACPATKECECKVVGCTDGMFIAMNKENEPLDSIVIEEISGSPSIHTFQTLRTGKVEVRAVCLTEGNEKYEATEIDILSSDLIGWWKFDETSGIIASDSSGYGNDGVLVNGPEWVQGKVGNALAFDGINDYVKCSISNGIPSAELTTAMWIYMRGSKVGFQHPFGLGDDHQWTLFNQQDTNTLVFKVKETEAGTTFLQKAVGEPGLNKWFHVAITWNGSAYCAYLNGTKKWCTNGDGLKFTNDHVTIGSSSWGMEENSFNGIVDDVRIYNRALSDSEIEELYEEGVTPTTTTSSTTTTTTGPTTTSTTVPEEEFHMKDIDCDEDECVIEIEKNTMSENIVVFIQLVRKGHGTIYYTANINVEPGSTGEKTALLTQVRECPRNTKLRAIASAYRQSDLEDRVDYLKKDAFRC